MKLSPVLPLLPLLPLVAAHPLDWFASEQRLVVTSENSTPFFIRESDKPQLRSKGVNFMDITHHEEWFYNKRVAESDVPVYNYPTNVSHHEQVESLIEQIDKGRLRSNLAQFSSFHSRYYKSDNGLKSATWLYSTLEEITADADYVTITKFQHSWTQFSIIVHIEGKTTPENKVVVGAHQDSTNLLFPNLLAAPGADDDGSGTTTNLEALRILIANEIQPENSVEFHFYSAEEGGLLGSLDIFTKYKEEGAKVVSMLQQDMTGYIQKTLDNDQPEHVGVISDYVSAHFTEFVKLIIDEYLSIPWVETKCGYACSDHASALQNGYPSSFIIESDFKYTNPYIHSTSDTLDKLSFDHIAEFTKLVLGYVYELGFHEFKEL